MSIAALNGVNSIEYEPSDLRKIYLQPGETLNVEPSAMLACKNVNLSTGLNGTIFEVAKRYFFGGESLFQNSYKANEEGGWLALEEAIPGQINAHKLSPGKELILGRGAYVASDANVAVSANYAGLTGWWKGLGFTKFNAKVIDDNCGRIFFNSTEGIVKAIKIKEEDGPVIVDNNNLIAYSSDLELKTTKMGKGASSLLFSGEGAVNEFKGKGVVYVGSGENASRENLTEKIIKAMVGAILPEPLELMNRVTLIGLVYIVAYSPNLIYLGDSIKYAGDRFVEGINLRNF
jgi:uncharacterized protein (TIGR00266 family)